ncbi:hypothetical protein BESB_013230 [Besnoitia besnoiti]|uniref:Uncharacterized protein n=1 Tax=Besnoitia besnoiti TaxID=94643 RepID=A0A2A9M8R8_BESBE|nr:hypothetical protein BESB_013230 [Besnoitia besnoiti]PFH32711.1 hypothetical protein BESB_013230 [Besnoitia besnoiti]
MPASSQARNADRPLVVLWIGLLIVPLHMNVSCTLLGRAIETASIVAGDLVRPHLGALAAAVSAPLYHEGAEASQMPSSSTDWQEEPGDQMHVHSPISFDQDNLRGAVLIQQAPIAPGLQQDDAAEVAWQAGHTPSSFVPERPPPSATLILGVLRETLSAAGAVFQRPRAGGRAGVESSMLPAEHGTSPTSHSPHAQKAAGDQRFTNTVGDTFPPAPKALRSAALEHGEQTEVFTQEPGQPPGPVLKAVMPAGDRNTAANDVMTGGTDMSRLREATLKQLWNEVEESVAMKKTTLGNDAPDGNEGRAPEGLLPVLFNADVANAAAAGVMIECKNPIVSGVVGESITLDLRGLNNDIYQLFLSGITSSTQDVELDVWNSAGIQYQHEASVECQEAGVFKLKFFIAGKHRYGIVPKLIYFCPATIVCSQHLAWKAPSIGHLFNEDWMYFQTPLSSQHRSRNDTHLPFGILL